MRIFLSILLLINIYNLRSQNIEVFGGINYNKFHDYKNNQGHYSSTYKADKGFAVGIGVDSIVIDGFRLRFTLQFDKYRGKLEVSDGGLGGNYSTDAKIDKSVISLGFFPLNLKIKKKLI